MGMGKTIEKMMGTKTRVVKTTCLTLHWFSEIGLVRRVLLDQDGFICIRSQVIQEIMQDITEILYLQL